MVDFEVTETLSEEMTCRLRSKCHRVTSHGKVPGKGILGRRKNPSKALCRGGESDRNQCPQARGSFLPFAFSVDDFAS